MFGTTTNRAFMRGLDLEERKRARQNGRFLLRKRNREELFSKRRKCILGVATESKTPEESEEVDVEQYLSRLQEFGAKMRSNDPSQRLLGISSLRKLVAMGEEPPLQQILESRVLEAAVRLVADHHKKIQLEAAWFLTNMATGSRRQTIEVIRVGTIGAFKQAMVKHRSNRDLMFQCVWGLSNLLGDGISEAHEQALAPEVLNVIGDIVNSDEALTQPRIESITNASWCLLNFCRGELPLTREHAQRLMGLLCTFREKFSAIHEVAEHVLYALHSISEVDQPGQGAVSHGVRLSDWCRFGLPRATTLAVECLDQQNELVFVSLRTIGNLALAEDEIFDQIWHDELVPRMMNLLVSDHIGEVRESCCLCSNILVSSKYEELISTELIDILFKLRNHPRAAVQREAIQCIGNLMIDASHAHVVECVEKGVVGSTVIQLLENTSEPKWVELGLLMLERILSVGEDVMNKTKSSENSLVALVEKAGGLDLLEKIQASDVVSEHLFNLAASLVFKYFHGEVEEE